MVRTHPPDQPMRTEMLSRTSHPIEDQRLPGHNLACAIPRAPPLAASSPDNAETSTGGSGLADFPHPTLRSTASLRNGGGMDRGYSSG